MTAHTSVQTAPKKQVNYPLLIVITSGATFLAFLDATITNLAIPSLHKTFPAASLANLSWVISLYMVFFAAILTPGGRLADAVGRRRLYGIGVTLFTLASLLSAVSPDVPVLLAARAVQGVGAAVMMPSSLAVLLMDTPADRRRRSIGYWSSAGALAAALGPALGGVLVNAFDWRALFLINIPLGALLLLGLRVLPRSQGKPGSVPDIPGMITLTAGIGALVLGITEASTWHWSDPKTIASLAGGVILVAITLWRSSTHKVPVLEIDLWKSRTFARANAASFFYGAALYAWLLVGVLYLTQAWRYSELQAGLALSPGAVVAAIVANATGRWRNANAPRLAVVAGALMIAAVGLWFGLALPSHPHFLAIWLPAALISAAGMGAITTGLSSSAALSVQPMRFASGIGLNLTARQVGGAFGIAILAAVVQSEASHGITPFEHVYLVCAALTAVAALIGLGLKLAPPAAPASPAAASKAAAPSMVTAGSTVAAPNETSADTSVIERS
jgi:EmrB/QacA subfamily drug resistance transporter